jgi:hypothetical protein
MKSKKLSILLIIFLILAFCVPIKDISAAGLGIWNRSSFATSTDMGGAPLGYLCFGATTWTSVYGKIIDFNWPTDFDLTGLTISNTASASEVEVYFGATDCTGTARVAEATPTAANDRDLVVITGQQLRLTLEDDNDGTFSIKFIDKTDGNTATIVTPATAGNYTLNLLERITTSGQPTVNSMDFIYVGALNEVNISASVDPSLSLALSSTTCDLGTLSAANIKTCNYNSTVSTNAANGYSAYIKADGAFRSATHNITDVGDGAVTATSEEYGVSTTLAAETISQINDADSSGTYTSADCSTMDSQSAIEATSAAITTGDQTFASSAAPINADVATLCHAVGITPTTPAGSYAQLVTITVTGNF